MPSDYRKLPDKALVDRYVQRNELAALHLLYERYGHLVYGVCCKYLDGPVAAGDTVRHIFTRLPDDLKQYHVEHFKSWLLRATKNYCVMRLRQAGTPIPPALTATPVAETPNEKNHLTGNEEQVILNRLETALNTLDTAHRQCIDFFYLEKMTISAIATKTGYTTDQVKHHIRKGKHFLRNSIKEMKD